MKAAFIRFITVVDWNMNVFVENDMEKQQVHARLSATRAPVGYEVVYGLYIFRRMGKI